MPSIFAVNRTALVTGASAGIGLEMARTLAPRVGSLIIVARRRERLEALATELGARFPSLRVDLHVADLSAPDAVDGLLRHLETRHLDVDVLVNNAGLGEFELFERSTWRRIRQIVDVNIVAMLRLTHQLLPAMIERGHGAILNIGSGAGYAAMPNAAVYTASKHFVRSFTESLRAQLSGTGIVVSEAAPGPVDSEFEQVAGIDRGAAPGQALLRISARECAQDIVRQFERGSPVIFPGRNYHRLMKLQPMVPRSLVVDQIARAAREIRRRNRG